MIGRRELVIAVLSAALVGTALGLVVGVVFTRATLGIGPGPWERPGGFGRPHADGPPRPGGRGPMMRTLAERLDLRPEQAARIDSILGRSRLGYEAMRESVRTAVERELTPEQRKKWSQMQRRFRRFRPPEDPPGGRADE